MSVLLHLQNTADSIKIQDSERKEIDILINSLSSKLNTHFDNIESKFVFGSYNRGTLLRRSIDESSVVNFMIVFSDGHKWNPQNFMNRLEIFAEVNYSTSDIYQSKPNVVLELNHIKFELTPAYNSRELFFIPKPLSNNSEWTHIEIDSLKVSLNKKNQDNNNLIRKLVRLMKYWNVKNGKVYSSYQLEKYIIDKSFSLCSNLKEYFFSAVEGLDTKLVLRLDKKEKINMLKEIVAKTKEYERVGLPDLALIEIKKAIP